MGISSFATNVTQSFPHYTSDHNWGEGQQNRHSPHGGNELRRVPSIWQTGKHPLIMALVKTEKYVLMWMKTIRHGMRGIGMLISQVLVLKTVTPQVLLHGISIKPQSMLNCKVGGERTKRHGLGKLVVNQNLFPLRIFQTHLVRG